MQKIKKVEKKLKYNFKKVEKKFKYNFKKLERKESRL